MLCLFMPMYVWVWLSQRLGWRKHSNNKKEIIEMIMAQCPFSFHLKTLLQKHHLHCGILDIQHLSFEIISSHSSHD